MTQHTLHMPRLGETMEAGIIVRWLKSEGDSYKRGEALLEIETDKTIAEYPALGNGVLREILAVAGSSVEVGAPIAQIEGDTFETATAAATVTERPSQTVAIPHEPYLATGAAVKATPAARALARDNQIALNQIVGSGRRGRIERRDVEALLKIRAQRKTQIQFLDTKRGRIAYTVTGNAAKSCYLLLHGFGGDMTTWTATAAGLDRADSLIVMPDLPAHGKSEAEAVNVEEITEALCELTATLPERLHLVGLSMGAAVAVELARRQKNVASLVLVSPVGIGAAVATKFVTGLVNAKTAAEIGSLLDYLGPRANVIFGAQARENLAGEISRGRLLALAQQLNAGNGPNLNIMPELSQLAARLPIKVVIGLKDKVIPVTKVPLLPPQVAVHVFAEAGHMPHWDQPNEFLDLLLGMT